MTWLLDWKPDPRFRHYTRANTGEVVTGPVSPLGWTLGFERGVLAGWRAGNIEIGVFREDELPEHHPPLAGIFGGYMFLNLSASRVRALRMPGADVELLTRAYVGDSSDAPPYAPDPADVCPECAVKTEKFAEWVLASDGHPRRDADSAMVEALRDARGDLARLTPTQLVGRVREAAAHTADVVSRAAAVAVACSIGPAAVEEICASVGRSDLFMPLFTGLGGVESSGGATALWHLSRVPEGPDFDTELQMFLRRFGARGPNEYDISCETWETDPALVRELIRPLRRKPDAEPPEQVTARLAAERADATAQMRALLAGDSERLARFDAALRSGQGFLRSREQYKTNLVKCLHEIRMAVRELGARAVAEGAIDDPSDVMMLLAEELDDFVSSPASLRARLTERNAEYRKLAELTPPFYLVDGLPAVEEWTGARRGGETPTAVAGEVLKGVPACPGDGTGTARVVRSLTDTGDLGPDDVLIAPHTDPAWTPLFLSVRAVVVETGARNSHAAIICRELGTPCVVSVVDATQRIPDGALVAVDGAAGTVTVLEA